MANSSAETYVRAALALQGYVFDEAQTAEIVQQFSRIDAIAQIVQEFSLPFDSQAAPVFRP
jgi:1-carboxybiuret hydrolase subunit AtzG-like protein